MLLTKYQGSMPSGFRQDLKKIFFQYRLICKACDLKGGATSTSVALYETNMVEVYKIMLLIKYQGSMSSGF